MLSCKIQAYLNCLKKMRIWSPIGHVCFLLLCWLGCYDNARHCEIILCISSYFTNHNEGNNSCMLCNIQPYRPLPHSLIEKKPGFYHKIYGGFLKSREIHLEFHPGWKCTYFLLCKTDFKSVPTVRESGRETWQLSQHPTLSAVHFWLSIYCGNRSSGTHDNIWQFTVQGSNVFWVMGFTVSTWLWL